MYASLAIEKGVKSRGLVLINTLRKNNSRLKWINETMVNVARYGGTSLLIMVGVILDTLQQIESYLLMRHYDGMMKSGKIKGRSV